MNYIKTALRVHTRNKWFTLINLVGLSLGIVCSTIIFLYVNFHLSTDSFHDSAERIYRLVLDIHTPNGTIEHERGSAIPMVEALRDEYSQIEKTSFCMKFYSTPTISVTSLGKVNKFKEHNVAYADNTFIEVFEHQFISGDKGTALIKPQSVVLSENQAAKFFGSVNVVGNSLTINNKVDLIVTGVVANPTVNSDLKFDMLISLPTLKILNPNYQDQNFTWIGSNNWLFIKLRDRTSAMDVNKHLPTFREKYLGKNFRHWHFHLQALNEMHFDSQYGGVVKKMILWILAGVGIALLCIVCINYINLSIALSYYRAKEIGIRKCLGSMRSQLFFQFLWETGIVVSLAVGIALTASYQVLPLINNWMQVELTLMQWATPDKIIYVVFFCIGVVLLAGYYPAIILSGFDPMKAITGKMLKMGGTSHLLRKSLITFQYTITLLFLISTFVIVSQVDYLLKNELGFSKDRIITLNLPRSNYSKLETFRNEIENLSGVESTSLHHQAPMSASTDGGFIKYDHRNQFEDFIVRDRWADDKFLDTYSLDLIAGRNLILHDSSTEVLINEMFLKKLNIPQPDAVLGRTISFDNSAISGTVVGVVRDFHHQSLQNEIEPVAIYPFRSVFNQLGVRVSADGYQQALSTIGTVWMKNFPDEVLDFSFLDQSISKLYQLEQTTGKLMSLFAGVSIGVCCMGVLGLSVFSTIQRTKEIGIRKVLGATAFHIILMLSRQYLTLFGIAFIIAIPMAYMVMHEWLNSFSYHISITWFVFVVPGLLIAGITLLLVGGQSFKTALTNPAESLKHE
jgi:putative ABC transport system permease protein